MIHFDLAFYSKLRSNASINRTKTIVLKRIGAFASLAGSTWEANFQAVCKIYIAIVTSQMTYSLSTWYTQSDKD